MRCLHESDWTGVLAGPRHHVKGLGPRRDLNRLCDAGTGVLSRRSASCPRRTLPGTGGGTDRAQQRHGRRAALAAMGLRGPP
jgi:hypothetical protein